MSSNTFAAEPHSVVIGLGLGVHSFSTIDETREGGDGYSQDEVSAAVMFEYYIEWYFINELAIGYRNLTLINNRELYISSEIQIKQEWTISTSLITLNWVLYGVNDYTRIGFIGGYGSSEYKITQTVEAEASSSSKDEFSTNGTATLMGIYVDWGDEGFGARFGYNALNTSYDKLKDNSREYEVDASGGATYFDFRWAF